MRKGVKTEVREMVTPMLKKSLTKQGGFTSSMTVPPHVCMCSRFHTGFFG